MRGDVHSTSQVSAFRFTSNEDFEAAVQELEELAQDQPVEYEIVSGSDLLVVPGWLMKRLKPRLERRGLPYEELKVVSLDKLPPEDQARRRGMMHSKK
jgi:hypothetical protein